MSKLRKLAQKFDKVITEHENMSPRSYMAEENLKSCIRYSTKILEMMNEKDDFPDWCDDKLSVAKHLIDDVYNYVANEKEAD